MSMTSLILGWLFAALHGARHASEPDHLVAVSTLIADASGAPGARRTAWLGAFWGMGHSVSLLAVGTVLLCLRLNMPGPAADGFELVVAVMLLVLGARSIGQAYRLAQSHGPAHAHAHGAHTHVHSSAVDHVHVGVWTMARRPFGIGLVHGLAGSGALTALALANMPSLATGLIYMVLFGLGSVLGMAMLAGVCGWQLQRRLHGPSPRAWLGALAGVTSLVLGVLWGWPPALRLAGF